MPPLWAGCVVLLLFYHEGELEIVRGSWPLVLYVSDCEYEYERQQEEMQAHEGTYVIKYFFSAMFTEYI